MMRYLLLSLLLTWSIMLPAQSALAEAERLIEKERYLDAYQTLDKADPQNQNADIAIAKSYLLLDYFSRSIMHQLFALSNLKPGETLEQLRMEEAGSYTMVSFEVDSILKAILQKEPDNFKVHLCLGRYYHEVYLKYGAQAYMPESVLLKNMEIHYRIALNNGLEDPMAAYGIGYAKLLAEDYTAAISYLKQSTLLDSTYAPAHYNLAYAYFQKNQRQEVIRSGRKAYNSYRILEFKADAARMIAVTYLKLDSLEAALHFYRISDSLQANNYYTLKTLLELEGQLDSLKFPETRLRFFNLAPENPTLYQDLFSLHMALDKAAELDDFYVEQLEQTTSEDTLLRGNLYLYRAILLKESSITEALWKQELEAALEQFQSIYPPEHQVFVFIDSYFKRKD